MAKSKNGGAFQFLRGSVGSVTFSTSTMNIAGVRQQIARQKVTDVTNPNTVAQIMQRMKVSPAQRFFNAINTVDATRLLEHSWEKLRYGNTGRLEFLRRAFKASGPYVPKGASRFLPAEYEIADGSLAPALVERSSVTSQAIILRHAVSGSTTAKAVLTAVAGGDENAQVTIVVVNLLRDGTYEPQITRWIPADMGDEIAPAGFPLTFDSSLSYYATSDNQVALAVIVSKQDASGAWLRSPAKMVVSWNLFNSLYSIDAMNSAIASYQAAGGNEYGSDWYLNLANGQPFPGNLSLLDVQVASLNGASVIVGTQPNGNTLEHSVFSVDGSDNTAIIVLFNGVLDIISGVTPASLEANIGYNQVVAWSPAMANQIGYGMSAALIEALTPADPDPRP